MTQQQERVGRLARGGALNLAGAGASAVLNLVFVLVLTHVTTRRDLGVFLTATSAFLVLATVGRMGANVGIVWVTARLRALGRVGEVRSQLRAATVPVVTGSLMLAVVTWLAADRIGAVVSSAAPGTAATVVRILSVFVPLASVSDILLSAIRGLGVQRALVLVERFGRPALQVLGLLVAVAVGSTGPAVVAWIWGAPYVFAVAAGLLWLAAVLRRRERADRSDSGHSEHGGHGGHGESLGPVDFASFWRFSLPQGVAAVLQVVLQRLDIVLIAALLGPVDAAVYGAVTRVLVVGQLGGQALQVTVQPAFSALVATDDRRGLADVYRASTGWLILSTWPLYLLMAVHHRLVPRIFGHGYGAGANVVLILCLAMLLATAVGTVDVLLAMSGRTRLVMLNSTAALTANVVLNLALIPVWGIAGSAVAWAASICINNLSPLAQVVRALHVHPFGREVATAVAVTVGCFLVLPLLGVLAVGETVPVAAATALVGVGVYVGCLLRLRVPLRLDDMVGRVSRHRRGGV